MSGDQRAEVRRRRWREIDELPHGPPLLNEREYSSREDQEEHDKEGSSWHYLPLVFALIPPLGAVIHGKADIWTDILMLLLLAYYLYNLVKVPWEMYSNSRSRKILAANNGSDDLHPDTKRLRVYAASELRKWEIFSLVLVMASPAIGGYALHYSSALFRDYEKYMTRFNINLFILTAAIRPLNHLIRLAKNRTIHLQQAVHYPSTDVELLKKRIAHLEVELANIQSSQPSKIDLDSVKEGIEPHIAQLNKAVRRYEKKEQYLRMYSEERFAYLEAKLHEYDSVMARRLQSEEKQSWFFQRGLFRVMFFPLNMTAGILSYVLPLGKLTAPQRMVISGPPSDDELSDADVSEDTLKPAVSRKQRLAYSQKSKQRL